MIDEAALAAAIETKALRAGLDVFKDEPTGGEGTFELAIGKHPSVYGTHHIGASTDQAQEAVADEAVRIVLAYLQSGRVPNCVNLAVQSAADHTLVVRHRDRVGVLASILAPLREAGINIQEMENIVFRGGEAACARIQIVGAPSDAVLTTIQGHPDVFSAQAVRIHRGHA